MALALLTVAGCGARYDNDGWPLTDCGMSLVGPMDPDDVQRLEVIVGRVFKLSIDARLHDVCSKAHGYRVELRETVTDPRAGARATDTVGGFTYCDGLIVVAGVHLIPHELAHVAQGCPRDDAGGHTGWDTDVTPHLRQVSACRGDDRYEANAPDGGVSCLADGSCPTICPPGARD